MSAHDEQKNTLESTCGQILELQDRGRKLTASGHFNPEACAKIPSVFVIGDKDNFACPKASMDVAKKIGAEVEIAKGGLHDPLETNPDLLDVFIAKVQQCVERHERHKTETIYIPGLSPPEKIDPIPYGMMARLRDRARFTLQSSASTLNPMARFF